VPACPERDLPNELAFLPSLNASLISDGKAFRAGAEGGLDSGAKLLGLPLEVGHVLRRPWLPSIAARRLRRFDFALRNNRVCRATQPSGLCNLATPRR
jgi:hypothetical protein